MNSSPFLSIGHRGAAAYATENTLSSIQAALDCQVDMVELDVRRTKDGQLVLGHDRYLHGQHSKLKISQHTLAQLQHLTLAGGETVPTLKQALEFINSRALINIDLKESGYEAEVVDIVKQLHLQHRVMFSSLSPRSLKTVKTINAEFFVALSYPSTYLIRLYDISYFKPFFNYLGNKKLAMYPFFTTIRTVLPYKVRRLAADQGIDALIIRSPFISLKLVDAVHKKELKLYTWPADASEDLLKLKKLGVDGASSNKPDAFHANPIT